MSAEITVSGSLNLDNGSGIAANGGDSGLRFDWTGPRYTKLVQQIGITEEALQLGEESSPLGWALIRNLDNTNFVELRTGTGATKFAKLLPKGGFALFYFGSGITAPFAISDTAACNIEILILSP